MIAGILLIAKNTLIYDISIYRLGIEKTMEKLNFITCYYSMKINCKAKNIKTVTKRVIREILVIFVSFLTNPIMIPIIETIQISFMDNPIKFTAIILTPLLYLYTIKMHLII
jgi:hypothetical protein